MGEVVSIDAFRRARTPRVGASSPHAQIDRLAIAVHRLESVIGDVMDGGSVDEPALCRELVAVNGAVALRRYSTAALRTERLVARLRSR